MVVRQTDHTGAQPDGARPLSRGGEEHLRRRDELPSGAMVLADPGLVEAKLIQPLDELQVTLQGIGRIAADFVERGHEDAEAQMRHMATSVYGSGGLRPPGASRCSAPNGAARSFPPRPPAYEL